jgi:endonuclease VIII
VAGIGNVYRSELCFLLGASPWAPVAELMDPAGGISLARTLLRRNSWRVERSTTGELARGRRTWVYERSARPVPVAFALAMFHHAGSVYGSSGEPGSA